MLNEQLRRQLSETLATLPNNVTLAVFTRAGEGDDECAACSDTLALVRELQANSGGRVQVDLVDLERDAGTARQYNVGMAPAIAVLGGPDGRTDYGIRIYGAPDGYEFATLVEDVLMASRGETDLMPATRDVLANMPFPLRIQVFVTPSCPYCPRAAVLAHSLSVASGSVTADVIDATEFPDLAARYRVRGVPRTIVNDMVEIEGAVPESLLLAHLMPLFEQASDAST